MSLPILERDPMLAEMVRRLVDALAPKRIYLFGSRARGEATQDSDYDLLVVVPDTSDSDALTRAYKALRGTGVGVDVVIWTETRFHRRTRVVCSLPATVLREGRLIYGS